MKKSIIYLLLAIAFLFTACEQPEGPQSLIGHWKMVADHWTADFDENGELIISSVKYDCFYPYYYKATADSMYIGTRICNNPHQIQLLVRTISREITLWLLMALMLFSKI